MLQLLISLLIGQSLRTIPHVEMEELYIYCRGRLHVSSTRFADNHAYCSRGSGGAIYATRITTIITQCQFIDNTASSDGGGVYALRGRLALTNSTLIFKQCCQYKWRRTLCIRKQISDNKLYFLKHIASTSGGAMYVSLYSYSSSTSTDLVALFLIIVQQVHLVELCMFLEQTVQFV